MSPLHVSSYSLHCDEEKSKVQTSQCMHRVELRSKCQTGPAPRPEPLHQHCGSARKSPNMLGQLHQHQKRPGGTWKGIWMPSGEPALARSVRCPAVGAPPLSPQADITTFTHRNVLLPIDFQAASHLQLSPSFRKAEEVHFITHSALRNLTGNEGIGKDAPCPGRSCQGREAHFGPRL